MMRPTLYPKISFRNWWSKHYICLIGDYYYYINILYSYGFFICQTVIFVLYLYRILTENKRAPDRTNITCSVIGLAGVAYLTSKRERRKWCLNASECRERITNCEHRGSLIQKLGSILASVKLVFSHWTYITLAGTIAAIFWIIFNVFEQLLFSVLS